MSVSRRFDHTPLFFLRRTFAAQLHALGVVLLVAEAFVLLPAAAKLGAAHVAACTAYLLTGMLVFVVSSTYHFLHDGYTISPRLEYWLENFDHFAIYLFIAGTYSPVLLTNVSEPWCTGLLIGIWAIALIGIAYTTLKPRLPRWLQHRGIYTGLFVAMGWFLVLRAREILSGFPPTGLSFFIAGCVAYSVGAVIYATRWPNLFRSFFGYHELWHLMVLLGAQFHFFMILALY